METVETIKLYDETGNEYRANPDQVEDCLKKGWTLEFPVKEDKPKTMKRKK